LGEVGASGPEVAGRGKSGLSKSLTAFSNQEKEDSRERAGKGRVWNYFKRKEKRGGINTSGNGKDQVKRGGQNMFNLTKEKGNGGRVGVGQREKGEKSTRRS